MSDRLKDTGIPVVSAAGIWYAYLGEQQALGDGEDHGVTLSGQDCYGNTSLFDRVDEQAVAPTTQVLLWVEVWFRQTSEILADREVAIQISGAQVRGRSKIVGNYAEARYAGLAQKGEKIAPIVRATSDAVGIADGYISIIASPV